MYSMDKTCGQCGFTGDADTYFYFYTRVTGRKAGEAKHTSLCKECTKKKRAAHVKANPEKIKEQLRKSNFKRQYGLSLEDVEQMKKDQNYLCAICCRKVDRLCVDHDHDTGKIRGMLCIICNHRILGASKDNPDILERAVFYLRGGGWEALKTQPLIMSNASKTSTVSSGGWGFSEAGWQWTQKLADCPPGKKSLG